MIRRATLSDPYLHTTTPTKLQKGLLHNVITANLAILTSTVWSYRWRIGHLRNAVRPGLEAIRRQLGENNPEQANLRVDEYFSRKFGAQFQATVEAGTVVLVHSLLDGVLTRLVTSFVLHNATRWEARILKASAKEYSLEESLRMNRASAFDRATDSYIRRLGKLNVIEKNTLVFGELTAEARTLRDELLPPGERLIERFDRFRHQIVHEDGLVKAEYKNALLDAEAILNHARALVFAAAATVGVQEDEIYRQMGNLGLEGVATPLTEDHLRTADGATMTTG